MYVFLIVCASQAGTDSKTKATRTNNVVLPVPSFLHISLSCFLERTLLSLTQHALARTNPSVLSIAEDIRLLLLSRFGVEVSEEEIQTTILDTFGSKGIMRTVAPQEEEKEQHAEQQQDAVQLEDAEPSNKPPMENDGLSREEEMKKENKESDANKSPPPPPPEVVANLDILELAAILIIPTLVKATTMMDTDLPERVIPPPDGLIERVLGWMLDDITGTDKPKALTKDLVRQILRGHGEDEYANDETLLDEMVAAAATTGPEDSELLDAGSFAAAPTNDVQLYDMKSEIRLSPIMDDVLMTRADEESKGQHDGDEEEQQQNKDSGTRMNQATDPVASPINKIWTFAAIDNAAGTYRAKLLMVLLWAAFIVTYACAFYGQFDF